MRVHNEQGSVTLLVDPVADMMLIRPRARSGKEQGCGERHIIADSMRLSAGMHRQGTVKA